MAPVAVLLSSIHCFHCSNAVWPYGYSSTEWTGMPASRTPESQWGTRSSTLTRLCLQIVAYPTDTGRHLCLIAANRTPCRRNQRARLQSHTQGLLLPKSLRIRVEARANVTERAVTSRHLQLMQASIQHYLQRTSTQLTHVAHPGPRLNTSILDLVPVQRMNARIPVHPCNMVDRPHRIQLTATHAFVDR